MKEWRGRGREADYPKIHFLSVRFYEDATDSSILSSNSQLPLTVGCFGNKNALMITGQFLVVILHIINVFALFHSKVVSNHSFIMLSLMEMIIILSF